MDAYLWPGFMPCKDSMKPVLLKIYIKTNIYLSYIDIYIFDRYLIEHYRHFLFFDLYWSYDIWWELVDKSSIISYFPNTFCLTLGHHQRRMYYKSCVTFVCILLLCKKSVCTVVLCTVYFKKLFLYIKFKKLVDKKMFIMFNQICINKEMLPKYTYTYLYTCMYMYTYIYTYMHISILFLIS